MTTPVRAQDFTGTLTTPGGLRVQLSPLRAEDIDAVARLEASAHSHPWGAALFRDCVGGRQMCVLARVEGELAGYFVVTAAAGDSELLNITLAPAHQGRGLGKALLRHLAAVLQPLADTLYLEVRASNARAIALYHSLGFSEVGIRPGYYPGARGREDAIIFALVL